MSRPSRPLIAVVLPLAALHWNPPPFRHHSSPLPQLPSPAHFTDCFFRSTVNFPNIPLTLSLSAAKNRQWNQKNIYIIIIIVLTIPVRIIWQIRTRWPQKLALACSLCLTVLLVALSAVRAAGPSMRDAAWDWFWTLVACHVALILTASTALCALFVAHTSGGSGNGRGAAPASVGKPPDGAAAAGGARGAGALASGGGGGGKAAHADADCLRWLWPPQSLSPPLLPLPLGATCAGACGLSASGSDAGGMCGDAESGGMVMDADEKEAPPKVATDVSLCLCMQDCRR